MQKIQELSKNIDQILLENYQNPPVEKYNKLLALINSRVDMPKNCILQIGKKISMKSKNILMMAFDLLEYLSYNQQLSFFIQIATKDFLFKISGLLMAKDIDSEVHDRILKTIFSWDELFRPHEDLLPLFFHFEAGLMRKNFQIPRDYVSPYRPKQLKQYRKPTLNAFKGGQIKDKATKSEKEKIQKIRAIVMNVNELISEADPSAPESLTLIKQMINGEVKDCQTKINKKIDSSPDQLIMEIALAANDDIYQTFRRYKDLQKGRKPQPFIPSELASDMIKNAKQQAQKKKQPKVQAVKKQQPKPSTVSTELLDFEAKPVQKVQQSKKQPDIFDLLQSQPNKEAPVILDQKPVDLLDAGSVTKDESANNIADIKFDAPQERSENKQISEILFQKSESNPADLMSQLSGINIGSENTVPPPMGITLSQNKENPPASTNFDLNAINFGTNSHPITLGTNNFKTQNDFQQTDGKTKLEAISDLAKELTDFSQYTKK